MDPIKNPYSPGAGRPPAALVGRDGELSTWHVSLQRMIEGRDAQSIVLYGLRGVGKTVLLAKFAGEATNRDWIVAKVEAGVDQSLRVMLSDALYAPLADLATPSAGTWLKRALKTISSFRATFDATGSWSFGLDLSEAGGGGADSGSLEIDLSKLVRDLSGAAHEKQIGLAILIDEAQELTREELTAVCSTAHLAGQNNWPTLFALAGLPSLPRELAEAKSYAERLFNYARVEQLSEDLARDALVEPSLAEGVTWYDEAVDLVVEQSSGYPYFLQQFGQETWNEATGPIIEVGDARVGIARGRSALDDGFFRVRWDRATPAEKLYLRAIAKNGEERAGSRDVAKRMNKGLSELGPARGKLIAKGLIYAPEHGVVAFTVPGMASFIQRQLD